ncbi:uncharacterized protein [Phaseolus vulgaris]|uniref:uncharacterized protein n=1 Tax=Phaseolus vulgaris TaxID=3885 RepID=UPI0035CC33EA
MDDVVHDDQLEDKIRDSPRTAAVYAEEVQQVETLEGGRREHQSLTQETLKVPKVSAYGLLGEELLDICQVDVGKTWMTPYRSYLADGMLPAETVEAKVTKKNSGRYTVADGKLFRHGYTHAILTCVSGDQCMRIMAELHEGICRSHVEGRALSLNAVWAGYYWPTMREDCMKYAQRCNQCQKHVDWHHAPPEESRSIHSP